LEERECSLDGKYVGKRFVCQEGVICGTKWRFVLKARSLRDKFDEYMFKPRNERLQRPDEISRID